MRKKIRTGRLEAEPKGQELIEAMPAKLRTSVGDVDVFWVELRQYLTTPSAGIRKVQRLRIDASHCDCMDLPHASSYGIADRRCLSTIGNWIRRILHVHAFEDPAIVSKERRADAVIRVRRISAQSCGSGAFD
jgi:hypothetical protein